MSKLGFLLMSYSVNTLSFVDIVRNTNMERDINEHELEWLDAIEIGLLLSEYDVYDQGEEQ